MRVPRWCLPFVVVGVFAASVWALRGLGLWRPRDRGLPPVEQQAPPTTAAPGGLPM